MINVAHSQIRKELKEIKHMVNEVICVALEMEEYGVD